MAREVRFKKQHKPIGFGDSPDPGTVEGRLNAMDEVAETRLSTFPCKKMQFLKTRRSQLG